MNPLRVLVIDDDPAFRLVVAALLEGDHRFAFSGQISNGDDALVLASLDPPDAVLLDLEHPGAAGFDLVGRLRRLLPDALLVVVSSYPAADVEDGVLAQGADAYLEKYTIDLTLAEQLDALR